MNNSRTRLKIITIGFNTYGTGLTRVMHNIMRRLADRHEIHYLGIGYSGETIRDRGLTIHPTNPKGGDVFAAYQAKRLIEEIDPALVFILHDIWCFPHYLHILGPYRDRLKIAIGGVKVAARGQRVADYDETPIAAHMKGSEIAIAVDVGVGKGRARVWTCDLTHGYIDINADYRS